MMYFVKTQNTQEPTCQLHCTWESYVGPNPSHKSSGRWELVSKRKTNHKNTIWKPQWFWSILLYIQMGNCTYSPHLLIYQYICFTDEEDWIYYKVESRWWWRSVESWILIHRVNSCTYQDTYICIYWCLKSTHIRCNGFKTIISAYNGHLFQ